MVEVYPTNEEKQAAYDAAYIMRLVAEKQVRRATAQVTKGEKRDE